MKKIFITGANGFIGRHLVNYLKNYEIYALIRPNTFPGFHLTSNVNIVFGDVIDIHCLESSITDNCIVINLAANPYHPKLSYQVNFEGVKNLITVCQKRRNIKLIQISSQATKLKKMGVYGSSKNMADQEIITSGVDYIILKPSLVYGEGTTGVFNQLIKNLSKSSFVPIFGNDNIKINPIHVEDLIELIRLLIEDKDVKNNIFEPGSVKFINYRQFFKTLGRYLGVNPKIIKVPSEIGVLAAKIFSLLKNPPFYIDQVLGASQSSDPNPYPILDRYNYKPIDFEEGLNKIFNQSKIKVGMIGMGKMGLLHTSILNTFPDVKVTALIDSSPAVLKTAKSLGITANTYKTLGECLVSQPLDAVFITTPTFTHFELIKKCLGDGLAVFVEKPAVLNKQQLLELSRIKNDEVIRVGYCLLYKDTFQKAQEMIKQKQFGDVISFELTFRHSEVLEPKNGWMFSKEKSGGGVLMNPGPHVFSLIYYLFGLPEKISAEFKQIYSREVEDQAEISIDFGDFKGLASLDWSYPNQELPYLNFRIIFTKGEIVLDGEKIVYKERSGKNIKTLFKHNPFLNQTGFNINPEANGEAYYMEDREFINSIKHKKNSAVNNLKESLKIESIIHSCYNNLI